MPSGDRTREDDLHAFWQASSVDALNAAAFGMRVLTYEPAQPSPSAISTPTAGQPLPAVRDRTQRLLNARRSGRTFRDSPLRTKELSRLLAAVGSGDDGRPLVPSAGGLGAVHTYAIGMRLRGLLDKRVGRYVPATHALHDVGPAPDAASLARLFQLECIGSPQVMLVFVIEPTETVRKYGLRGVRFALQEVGHAAQNVGLRAAADGFVAYVVGGGLDDEVLDLLGLSHTPALLGGAMAVGR